MSLARRLRREDLILAGILLLALSLRWIYFVGVGLEDDLGFCGVAWNASRGHWPGMDDQAMRVMTYMPIALAFRVLGLNTISAYFYDMLCALITILTSYFITRRLHGFRAAVCASLFLTFIPLHIFYSSRIMPSLPEAMWGGLAIWLLCSAEDLQRIAGDPSVCFSSYVGVGFLVGMAYLCRETGIVLLGAILVYLVLEGLWNQDDLRVRTSQIAFVFAGFFVIYGAESTVYFLHTYDWLNRWHVVRQAQASTSWGVGPPWYFYLQQLLNMNVWTFDIFKHQLSRYDSSLGLMGFAILASLIPYAWKGATRTRKIVILWFFAYFLFLSFGVASLSSHIAIRKFQRYQILFLTPTSIMAGWFLASLSWHRIGKYFAWMAGVGLIGSSLYYTHHGYDRWHSYYRAAVHQRQLIHCYVDPDLPVYVFWINELLDNYRPIYRYDNFWKDQTLPTKGAYVIASKFSHTDQFTSGAHENTPFLSHIPPDWIKIAELDIGYWENFDPGTVPVLFYVPPTAPQ